MPTDISSAIGPAITIATVLITIGGAWKGVKVGIQTLKEMQAESTTRLEAHLKELTMGVDSIRREFLTKELYAAQEKTLLTRIEALERTNELQKRRRSAM